MEKKIKLNRTEKIDWLRLRWTQSIGPITFKHLLAKFGSASEAIKELPAMCQKVGRKKNIVIPLQEKAAAYFDKCEKNGIELLASCESDFPKHLKRISDTPPLIHIKGKKELLNKESLAIVGSRNASLQGIALTEKLTKELSSDFIIVSGLARGIDAAAHKAAIKTGTIAVLAGGIDIIYPQENKELYEEIAKNGVLVSEANLGQEPRPESFTYRNRIVSGIASAGVLVIEAAIKSGSLITARYAAEQGKDVFAIPGHPYDPRAQGTNQLIKQGAFLVERANDILEHQNTFKSQEISLFDSSELNENYEEFFEEAKDYLRNKLGSAPMAINEIIRNGLFSVSQIQGAIAELELSGEISFENRNQIRKI